MFILRVLFNSGIVHNQVLGNHYQLITDVNRDEFKRLMKNEPHDMEDVFGFVSYGDNDVSHWTLYKNHQYSIMSDKGNMYEKIYK